MSFSFTADRRRLVDAVDLELVLESLLRLVRDNNGFSRSLDGEFWFAPTSSIDLYPYVDEEVAIAQYLAYRNKMRAMHDTCSLLLQSAAEEFWRISHKMVPVLFGRGLASLPDEILAEIIEWSGCDPLELRLVSRRFHRIVMSLPRLWTSIPYDAPLNRLQLSLKHSLEKSLDVRLVFDDNSLETIRRMEIITPHAHRISRLKVDCFTGQTDLMNTLLHAMNPSRLQSLIVTHSDRSQEEDGTIAQSTFYDGWYTPRLEVLKLIDDIPKPIRGMSLRECTIDLTSHSAIWNLSHLSTFFAASPALERLTMYLMDFGSTIGDFEPVAFHRLEFLEITVQVDEGYFLTNLAWDETIAGILNDAPNLGELRCTTFIEDGDELDVWFHATFDTPHRFPNLHTLDLSIRRAVDPPQYFIRRLFTSMPELRHFTLETLGLKLLPNYLDVYQGFPPLESISFRRCFRCDDGFFHDILRGLAKKWKPETESEARGRKRVTVSFVGCSNLRRGGHVNYWSRFFAIVWNDVNNDWRYYTV